MRISIAYTLTLLVGLFYYVLFSAVAAGGSGLTAWAAVPIIAALLLGGFAPGLMLLRPRAGFIFAAAQSGVLILYILLLIGLDPAEVFALIATIPALAVIGMSVRGWRRWKQADSVERRRRPLILIPAVIPALPAAWLIVGILGRFIG